MTTGTDTPTGPHRGCTEQTATRVAVGTALVSLFLVTGAASLALRNLYGPFGEAANAGLLAATGCGAAAAAALSWLTRWAARRSRSLVAAVLVVAAGAAWVLFPRPVDVSESWVPQPNPRWACAGWTFRYYPPGTMDADATTYCVGLERRISDG
jgi:hypothetical protein